MIRDQGVGMRFGMIFHNLLELGAKERKIFREASGKVSQLVWVIGQVVEFRTLPDSA